MRCATPGIDVDCTGKPATRRALTIQLVSTPPPSPPSAAMSRVSGRCCESWPSAAVRPAPSPRWGEGWGEGVAERCAVSPLPVPLPPGERGRCGASAAKQRDHARADSRCSTRSHSPRVAHDLGAVERRAQHRGMRDLAAQAAADAAFDHRRHRIGAQRIGIGLHRQRRAARQPDAGMVAGADLVVDAVARLAPRARRA